MYFDKPSRAVERVDYAQLHHGGGLIRSPASHPPPEKSKMEKKSKSGKSSRRIGSKFDFKNDENNDVNEIDNENNVQIENENNVQNENESDILDENELEGAVGGEVKKGKSPSEKLDSALQKLTKNENLEFVHGKYLGNEYEPRYFESDPLCNSEAEMDLRFQKMKKEKEQLLRDLAIRRRRDEVNRLSFELSRLHMEAEKLNLEDAQYSKDKAKSVHGKGREKEKVEEVKRRASVKYRSSSSEPDDKPLSRSIPRKASRKKGVKYRSVSSDSDRSRVHHEGYKHVSKGKSGRHRSVSSDSDGSVVTRKSNGSDRKDKVSLSELRALKHLQSKVEKKMEEFGLDYSESSEESDSDVEDDRRMGRKRRKGEKKIKSGIEAESCSSVVSPQLFPHAMLQEDYVNKKVKFADLDFRLFVAGELEIITSEKIGSEERKARSEILKQMAYFQGIYEWPALLNAYAALLRKIELGKFKWDSETILDKFGKVQSSVLAGRLKFKPQRSSFNVSNSKSAGSNFAARVWFCTFFNRGRCSKNESHMVHREGKPILVEHICAQCWLNDKVKRNHCELDTGCPNFYKKRGS